MRRIPVNTYVWLKIHKKSNGCWLWTGSTDRFGYGILAIRSHKNKYAHRIVYEMTRGPIPQGLTLDHLCGVKACVNPEHLEPVTIRVNILRAVSPASINAAKTQCVHGHPLTPHNTYRYFHMNQHGESIGHRFCKTCIQARAKNKRFVSRPKHGRAIDQCV